MGRLIRTLVSYASATAVTACKRGLSPSRDDAMMHGGGIQDHEKITRFRGTVADRVWAAGTGCISYKTHHDDCAIPARRRRRHRRPAARGVDRKNAPTA